MMLTVASRVKNFAQSGHDGGRERRTRERLGQEYDWMIDQTAACLSRIELVPNKVAFPDQTWYSLPNCPKHGWKMK